ncbi:MAG: hypothetical protein VXZ52_05635 [Candidatus Thermoplasmatota archaeon]|nr:hypothetical protein [Candidatus Thermoplasmatota archaeon]
MGKDKGTITHRITMDEEEEDYDMYSHLPQFTEEEIERLDNMKWYETLVAFLIYGIYIAILWILAGIFLSFIDWLLSGG